MPLTERKGRFTVTQSECFPSEAPAAEKRVKRGRFTVSTCLPCARGTRTSSVDSKCSLREALVVGHSVSDESCLGPFAKQAALRGTAFEVTDSASTTTRDSTPSKDQQLCDSSSWDSCSTCSLQAQDSQVSYDVPSPGKGQRRVRFSEPETSMDVPPPMQSAPVTAMSSSKTSLSAKQHRFGVPAAPAADQSPKPITRSYCRGRFVVQEAVLLCCSLPRSFSVPEVCTLEDILARTQQPNMQHQQQAVAEAGSPVAAAAATPVSSCWVAASAAPICETSGLAATLSDISEYHRAASAVDQRHNRPLKRSHTVSYFRRGR